MLTRRATLFGVVVGLAARPGRLTPVSFDVPPHACDCHTHIFGDPTRFPLWAGRTYTPEPALPDEMAALHVALHIERVVIVTPSVYGTDNAATIEGLRARRGTARGIAVIGENTPESDLDAMGRAGVCGIRLNLTTAGQSDPAAARRRFQAAATRVERRAWHVQLNTNLAVVEGMWSVVRESPVPVVFDHFGGAVAAAGPAQPGFAALLDLVRSGHAYVKLSAVYHVSARPPDYPDAAPLARVLIAANPGRILWGTDWPHPAPTPPGRRPTDVTPRRSIDDGRILNQLPVWAPEAAVRKQILVDNPARLYGFGY